MITNQSVDIVSLRRKISERIAEGNVSAASLLLGQVWREYPNLATASYVLSTFDTIKSLLNPISFKLAILRSFTVEPVVTLCRAGAAIAGIDLNIKIGEFNAYAQEIIDQNSGLYQYEPDAVILAVQTRDIVPELWYNYVDLSPKEIEEVLERVVNEYAAWTEVFRSRSQAHLVMHLLEKPVHTSQGLYDQQASIGQNHTIDRINLELISIAKKYTGVYLLDYEALVARHGKKNWHDTQKWLAMRMPISGGCLIYLANEWLKFIHPLSGRVCKVLVCDLDNTLWGGIIGEDGIHGIKLSREYPGAAYIDFQRTILDLYQRGVILAICSKNNRDDAMEVLEKHPDMLLRPQHFASIRINWTDKVQNLQSISEELNIGIDAIAFVDDNPIERELVRNQLPQVTVIDLPKDPFLYAHVLQDCHVFERLKLSEEDRERGRMYVEQRKRAELQQSAVSLEDFYYSLSMKMEVTLVTPFTLSRVAQLTQKTNQFNLTTRRYTEQMIEELAKDQKCHVYTVRMIDRFGDNGIVGVMIIREQDENWEIDTFLMSCRVIGRTVETAMLATLTELAKAGGARNIIGWFFPTKKNAPSRDFYAKHGLLCTKEALEGSCWKMDLSLRELEAPPWIERTINVKGTLYDNINL